MVFLEGRAFLLFSLIPILILLHLLKLRRRDQIVPSTMLWSELIQEAGANALFRRFKRSLQLPIQIALISCLALALARPVITATAPIKGRLLLIVDSSASMSANEDGETRLSQAKRIARSLVHSLKPQDVILVEAGTTFRVLLKGERGVNLVRKAIENISPSDGPGNLKTAIISNFSEDISAIAVVTDRTVNLSELPGSISNRLMVYRVGKSRPNYGITGLKTTYNPLSSKHLLSVTISAFNAPAKEITLWIYADDEPFIAKMVQVDPNLPGRVTVELGKELEGREIGVRLDVEDSLELDNSAGLILRPSRRLKILVVKGSERSGFFLERSLRSSPIADVRAVKPEGYLPGSGFDLTIFDNWVPPEIPQGSFVFINPRSGLPSALAIRSRPDPIILDWDRSHPIMRYLDLSGVKVKEMWEYEMPPWAVPIVETDGQPLIWIGEDARRRGVIFSFDAFNPDATDLPLRTECPVMMENLIEWFSERRNITPAWVRIGDHIALNLTGYPEFARIEIILPDGERKELDPDSPVFLPLRRGVHRVLIDGKEVERFVANMVDGAESDLTVSPEDRVVKGEGIKLTSSRKELWRWFALAGIVLMALEWWAYHERR
jgi:hypothetical protein